MGQEHNVIGVILATDVDRQANQLLLRGMMPFFGHPIIKLIYQALNNANINSVYVYTIKKGIIIKEILGKKVKYILKSNEYISRSDCLVNDFHHILETNTHILFVDPKYPLLDGELLNELINLHLNENNDLTTIESKYQNMLFVPNVFIVNIQILNQVFNNNQTLRQLDSKKIFECAKKMNKAVGVLSTDKIYKILSINNYHAALDIEAIFLKRK